MSKFGARLRKHKHIFLYTAAAFLISALIAGGASLLQSDDYLPSLDGDISAIAVTDNTILCAVSRDQDILRIPYIRMPAATCAWQGCAVRIQGVLSSERNGALTPCAMAATGCCCFGSMVGRSR